MLEYLRIQNLALIEDMELEFDQGMNVLTGETGAGKSFILKALGFLLGDRLKADMVRPGAERAHVEALFSLDAPLDEPDRGSARTSDAGQASGPAPETAGARAAGSGEAAPSASPASSAPAAPAASSADDFGDECQTRQLVLRRDLLASGRSRLTVNGALKPQEYVRELRGQLLSYTSQHGQQKLLQPAFQEALMEQALDRPDLLAERAAILADLEKIRGKIRDLEARRDRLLEVRDLLEMQQAEIDKVNPQPDEDDELEELRLKVRRQEEAARDYDEALGMLYGNGEGGLLDGLAEFGRLLERLAETDERLASSCESVTALTDDLRRLGGDLRRPPVPDDLPDDIESVEARLYELSALKRKLRRDLPSILNLKKEIEEKIDFLDVCALDIKELRRREAARAQDLARLVETLIPLRRTACQAFAARLESELRGLGFSDQARVLPDFKPRKLWDNVTDEAVRILWAPNPGQPAQPLDLIASGGELSRFLLALAGVAPAEHRPTFIFDEVDSGVGGVTLNHLAERLERLAGRQQMLLVTHWPQIAARAKKHFQISKVVRDGRTYTTCLPLKGRDLHDELVRMGGGGAQGEALASALEHRKELPRSA